MTGGYKKNSIQVFLGNIVPREKYNFLANKVKYEENEYGTDFWVISRMCWKKLHMLQVVCADIFSEFRTFWLINCAYFHDFVFLCSF